MAEPLEDITAKAQLPQAARFARLSAKNERRNFRSGVTNGVLYGLGIYFVSGTTIIPSFLSHLTRSSAVIGIVSQFLAIGWYLPQFVAASFVVHQPRKLPLYRIGWWIRGAALFALAGVTLAAPGAGALLALAILFYGLFAGGAGLSGVVFLDLVAKTIPERRRGRFFGLRLSLASVLSMTIGAAAISLLLDHFQFPVNFGFVFLAGAIIVTIGLGFMAYLHEPRSKNVPDARTLRQHFREGWRVYRYDKLFARYINARLVFGAWTIGVPFLVLFAQSKLGFRTADLGIFVAAGSFGTLAGNFLWEHLTDRHSAKACLEIAALVSAIMPVVLLLYLVLPLPRLIYALVFAVAAAVDAGTTIGGWSYLIEISPEHDRATYIGLFNSLMALPLLLTALAGALLDLTGFGFLYALVLALSMLSLWMIHRLEPNRDHRDR
ncbi:MAG TPA: MFS transporter [Candidatus Kapabacteria bacterium]|nr:MFS transporter [Candidatus Kapabacteria bacterium]